PAATRPVGAPASAPRTPDRAPSPGRSGSAPPRAGMPGQGRSLLDEGPRISRKLLLLGAAVLAVAVIAVALVLSGSGASSSSSSSSAAASSPTTTASKSAAARRRAARRATARTTVVVPSTVTVAVLNGTSTNNLAHDVSTKLSGLGYKQGAIATASDQTHTQTVVAYTQPAYRPQAEAVAKSLGLSMSTVQGVGQSDRTVACSATPTSCPDQVVVTVGSDLSSAG
ncbi:MAG: LytR C-terminal domain-containing protein, partial [Solirubrobacteraceae bacterium]